MIAPLHRRVAVFLAAVHDLGAAKDEAIAAAVADASQGSCDRSAVTRWRSGERTAPLGLLFVLLDSVRVHGHPGLTRQRQREILDLLARPLGLRVVDEEAAAPASIQTALHLAGAAGDAARLLADGHIDADERADARRLAESLRTLAAQLDAAGGSAR